MNDFFTWSMLATYAGATAATVLFTQLLKGVGVIEKIPTKIFSYVIALIVLVLSQVFIGNFSAQGIALCFFNAGVVALAAQGGYELIAHGISSSEKE